MPTASKIKHDWYASQSVNHGIQSAMSCHDFMWSQVCYPNWACKAASRVRYTIHSVHLQPQIVSTSWLECWKITHSVMEWDAVKNGRNMWEGALPSSLITCQHKPRPGASFRIYMYSKVSKVPFLDEKIDSLSVIKHGLGNPRENHRRLIAP